MCRGQVLERFFETKVAVPPYRQNTLKTFIAMLNTQAKVLRDFIRILQLEEITSDPSNPQVGVEPSGGCLTGTLRWVSDWNPQVGV